MFAGAQLVDRGQISPETRAHLNMLVDAGELETGNALHGNQRVASWWRYDAAD